MVDYMAERLQNNIRQIEGVLKRLNALYSLSGVSITKESIDQTISIIDPGNIPTDALVEKILSTVSSHFSISIENLKSKKRNDSIANARHVAMYLIKNLTELTLKAIGEIFNRDYSTVISSISKVELNIKTKHNASSEIKKLIKEIKSQ
jgi:chromosomal replication initiator protein